MKIALIRQRYTPYGGAERYMSRLVDNLMEMGHEVHIFASKWEINGKAGFIFHRVPFISSTSWLRSLSFAFNCRRLIRNERFDIIFSLERTLLQDVYRAGDGCHRRWLVQKNMGKGIIARLGNFTNPLHWAYLWLEKRLFTDPKLRGVIANSRLVKDDIIASYSVLPERVHVIYNGLDPTPFDEDERDRCRSYLADEYGLHDELRILFVGSGFDRKGVPTLLNAVANLAIPFRLFIVGKGKIRKYQKMAARLGVDDRITFTGPLKDVERFYLGCDLFVFPTLYDPFSNATLEAMAHGLPVITSRFNGAAEIIDDGKNGYVVSNPLADEELAVSIMRLATFEECKRIGEEACRTAALFTMERNLRETMKVLTTIYEAKSLESGGIGVTHD
jgi:UDP-glucose:(heptosyl)LPS alpha-1,3-glucosyltransferase